MCDILRSIAQYCSSTGLALSMHQHLLAANIWKFKRGQGGGEMLKRVAADQPVLVSTGARDWLESNGEVEKVEGRYLVSALKHFASQSAVGDVLVTSAPYQDPDNGLHWGCVKSDGDCGRTGFLPHLWIGKAVSRCSGSTLSSIAREGSAFVYG